MHQSDMAVKNVLNLNQSRLTLVIFGLEMLHEPFRVHEVQNKVVVKAVPTTLKGKDNRFGWILLGLAISLQAGRVGPLVPLPLLGNKSLPSVAQETAQKYF